MEKLEGIIERVTFHNEENGWSVLKVAPFKSLNKELVTVVVHQAKVYAGATVEFAGEWINHNTYGTQFKAHQITEKRPASLAALEKYLGSGLIYGVGPKTAKKIVKHFGNNTLDVFENNIEKLTQIQGIAQAKLKQIKEAWTEHREVRNVTLFLQEHGVSTLYAVKIYKTYGDKSIEIVSKNPYQLARDIYGIGFFSADKIAASLGFKKDSPERIMAGIKHILSTAREEGHCYLKLEQITQKAGELLGSETMEHIPPLLFQLETQNELKSRKSENGETLYYAKSLYYDEVSVAQDTIRLTQTKIQVDNERVHKWLEAYSQTQAFPLSQEQQQSVFNIVQHGFSILTGGPGCGKTTTTKTLVKLLLAMGKKTILAAPTGRAAQRMSEVIGLPSQTIHRLLVWEPQNNRFKTNREAPLDCDFLIIDECSMLDISLTASLLQAVPDESQVLFIGDTDQLPSVGAGNVLRDLIESKQVPCFRLTQVFRQAQASKIITFAHEMNKGLIPQIESPIHRPDVWTQKVDCLFIDSEEATQEDLKFISRAKIFLRDIHNIPGQYYIQKESPRGKIEVQKIEKNEEGDLYFHHSGPDELEQDSSQIFQIHKKYRHLDLGLLNASDSKAEEIRSVLKKVHPWSTLHYGLTATDMIKRLYSETIPKYLGKDCEIQILSPMTKGSLGTGKLNAEIQSHINPASSSKAEIRSGDRLFRSGDRIIQRRNNYDLGVFNGDIGRILQVFPEDLKMEVEFGSKSDKKVVLYEKENLLEIDLAYAVTIHKSQGSEFDVVIIPVTTQHFKMLFRNLTYTGLTRAKKLAIFIGTRKALALAVKNTDNRARQTYLKHILQEVN